MLGKWRELAEGQQEVRVQFSELDAERIAINRDAGNAIRRAIHIGLGAFDGIKCIGEHGAGSRDFQEQRDGPSHIISRQGVPIMPFQAVLHFERDGHSVVTDRIAFRQLRPARHQRTICRQEMIKGDLAVHIDTRVQPAMLKKLARCGVGIEHLFAIAVLFGCPVDNIPIVVELVVAILTAIPAHARILVNEKLLIIERNVRQHFTFILFNFSKGGFLLVYINCGVNATDQGV